MTRSTLRVTSSQSRSAARVAREIVTDMKACGLTIPKSFTERLAVVERVNAMKPKADNMEPLIQAYEQHDPQKVDEATLAAISASARIRAWELAVINVGASALAHIRSEALGVIADMGKPAKALIKRVTDTANLNTHELNALMKAGRTADAEAVVSFDVDVAQLETLYQLRDKISGKIKWTDHGNFNCSIWKDERPALAARDSLGRASGPEYMRRAITGGAELWWPTPSEAIKAAADIAAELAAAHQEAIAQQRREGRPPNIIIGRR